MNTLNHTILHSINYTTESILMAVLVSNLLLVIIGLLMINQKILLNIGYKVLMVFLIMTMVRFLIPLDLRFSKPIWLPDILSAILRFFTYPIWKTKFFSLRLSYIVGAVWLAGSLYRLLKYLRDIWGSRRFLILYSEDLTESEPYRSLLQDICRKRHRKNRFKVVRTCGVGVPMVYGVVKPWILFPENFEISDDDMYFVLHHEASHAFHHHLLLKFGINVLTILYWWNPVVYLFQKYTALLLELQVDDKVTGGDLKERMAYMNCLVRVKEYVTEHCDGKGIPSSLAISFISGDDDVLGRRFALLFGKKHAKAKAVRMLLNTVLVAVIVGIYYLSYQFIFEALYQPDYYEVHEHQNVKDTKFSLDPGVCYAIENADGTFSIFINTNEEFDLYIDTVNDLSEHIQVNEIFYLEKGKYKK